MWGQPPSVRGFQVGVAVDRVPPERGGREGRPGVRLLPPPPPAGRPSREEVGGRGPGAEKTPSVSAGRPTFRAQLEREAERLGR